MAPFHTVERELTYVMLAVFKQQTVVPHSSKAIEGEGEKRENVIYHHVNTITTPSIAAARDAQTLCEECTTRSGVEKWAQTNPLQPIISQSTVGQHAHALLECTHGMQLYKGVRVH